MKVGASAVLALLLAVGTPPAARGTETEDHRARFGELLEQAMARYADRDYGAAIRLFEQAYALEPKPELVYNIARSHEKALRWDEAIVEYERFVQMEGTTAELRAKALESLVALRREQAARLKAEAAVLEHPHPHPHPAPLAQAAPYPSVEARNRGLEWSLIGGGAALAVTGAVFGVLALDAQAALEDARAARASPERLANLADTTRERAVVTDVLLVSGLSLAVGGALLLWLGDQDGPVAAPMVGEQGTGVSFTGRF